ncbi:ESP [Symbiodinium natans]|uniref:ESP protein n=1 Tax=Symbiodinium natans TaxID=878477 RepID=A0A812R5D0_9DINO|nr:ESP [Symbiodinium natans]
MALSWKAAAVGERLVNLQWPSSTPLANSCNTANTKEDMYTFDVNGKSWADITGSDSNKPQQRLGAGMAYDGSDTIYLHGGLQLWGASHDLYSYTISTSTWTNMTDSVSGGGPQQKVWHSFVYANGNIYSFAGASPYGTGTSNSWPSQDLWQFNIGSSTWSQISGTMPGYRLQQGMVHANSQGNDYLVLFGGFGFVDYPNSWTTGYFSDLWIFDITAGVGG